MYVKVDNEIKFSLQCLFYIVANATPTIATQIIVCLYLLLRPSTKPTIDNLHLCSLDHRSKRRNLQHRPKELYTQTPMF